MSDNQEKEGRRGIFDLFKKSAARDFSNELDRSTKMNSGFFMNKSPCVLDTSNTLLDAVELFAMNSIDVIIVKEGTQTIGTLSKSDILRKAGMATLGDLRKVLLKYVVSRSVNLCNKTDSLETVCNILTQKGISNLIVKDSNCGGLGYMEILSAFRMFSFKIDNPPIVSQAMEKKVSTIEYNANINRLIKSLNENSFEYAIALKNKEPVGIVTIKDLLSAIPKGTNFESTSVMGIFSPNIVHLNPGNSINEALSIMLDRKFNQIPVISEGKIVGVVTLKSLFNAFVKYVLELKNGVQTKNFDKYVKVVWQS